MHAFTTSSQGERGPGPGRVCTTYKGDARGQSRLSLRLEAEAGERGGEGEREAF